MIVHRKNKMVFFHIPRNGGTAIRKALMKIPGMEVIGGHQTPEEAFDKWPAWLEPDWWCWSIERNPSDRLSSIQSYCEHYGLEYYLDVNCEGNRRELWPQSAWSHPKVFPFRYSNTKGKCILEKEVNEALSYVRLGPVKLEKLNSFKEETNARLSTTA